MLVVMNAGSHLLVDALATLVAGSLMVKAGLAKRKLARRVRPPRRWLRRRL